MTAKPASAPEAPSGRDRKWGRRILHAPAFAWILSLAMHGGVMALFCQIVLRDEAHARRIVIPEARLTEAVRPGAEVPPPGLPTLETNRRAAIGEVAVVPVTAVDPRITTGAQVAVTLGRSAPAGPARSGPLMTAASPLSSGLAAAGPSTSFFGQVGNASRIVYVVDVSASLTIYTEQIVHELCTSIDSLLPTQKFHIILARPRRVEELSFRRLVPAVPRYTRAAHEFIETIDLIPGPGAADPIEAMRRAFAVQPELIYFLSDGDYRLIEKDLEATLEQLNADRAVKITTIAFSPAPRPAALLRRIAERHGGHFRAVDEL